MKTQTYLPLFGMMAEPKSVVPPQVWVFAVFAVIVSIGGLVLLPFTPDTFRAWLVPHTGWLASGTYPFTIVFAFQLIVRSTERRNARYVIRLQLLLMIIGGIFSLNRISNDNFGNPYLTVSLWQPVWTILIPCIWMAVLHTPRMNRFCR